MIIWGIDRLVFQKEGKIVQNWKVCIKKVSTRVQIVYLWEKIVWQESILGFWGRKNLCRTTFETFGGKKI